MSVTYPLIKGGRCNEHEQATVCDGLRGASGSTSESGRQYVKLRTFGATGRRLYVPHFREIALERCQQLSLGASAKDLGQKGAARRKHLPSKFGRRLGKCHDAQVVCLGVSGRWRRHVGEHHVRTVVPQPSSQSLRRRRIHEIEANEINAGKRRHLRDVNRDHLPSPLYRLDALCRHLAPSARSCPKVDDSLARLQEVILIVDLDQLVSRA